MFLKRVRKYFLEESKKTSNKVCCVENCRNVANEEDNVVLFPIPERPDPRWSTWLKASYRNDIIKKCCFNIKQPKSYFICSIHFEDTMFADANRQVLLPNAEPTLYVNFLDPEKENEYDNVMKLSYGPTFKKNKISNYDLYDREKEYDNVMKLSYEPTFKNKIYKFDVYDRVFTTGIEEEKVSTDEAVWRNIQRMRAAKTSSTHWSPSSSISDATELFLDEETFLVSKLKVKNKNIDITQWLVDAFPKENRVPNETFEPPHMKDHMYEPLSKVMKKIDDTELNLQQYVKKMALSSSSTSSNFESNPALSDAENNNDNQEQDK